MAGIERILPPGLAEQLHNNYLLPALLLSLIVHLSVLFIQHAGAPQTTLPVQKIDVFFAQPSPPPPAPAPQPKRAVVINKPLVEAPLLPPQPPEPVHETSPVAQDVPPNATPTTEKIERISSLSRVPAPRDKIEPAYPPTQRRAGVQAFVLAEVVIDATGKVREVRILKSAGAEFDNSVIAALQNSTFTPGYIGENAVSVRVAIPFRFKLN